MADMKKVYDDLIIINLYLAPTVIIKVNHPRFQMSLAAMIYSQKSLAHMALMLMQAL
jgi:hypothetical protein